MAESIINYKVPQAYKADTATTAQSAKANNVKAAHGTVNTSVPNGSYKEYSVRYSGFDGIPAVSVAFWAQATGAAFGNCILSISEGPTASGFKFRVFNNSGAARSPAVYWSAVYVG